MLVCTATRRFSQHEAKLGLEVSRSSLQPLWNYQAPWQSAHQVLLDKLTREEELDN